MMNKKISCLLTSMTLFAFATGYGGVSITGFEKYQYADTLSKGKSLNEWNPLDTIHVQRDTSTYKKIIQIKEVNVFRKFNPIKLTAGKLSYQVSKSLVASTGNALELLRKMPGVVIMSNGKISLNGQEGVQLLIDGKTNFVTGENLISYLSAMPASALDVVELITQPDATLDAAGDARIINLKRNTKPSNGFGIVISSNNEQGKYHRMHHNIMLQTNTKKVNLLNSYSYSSGRELIDITSTRYLTYDLSPANKGLELDMDAIRKKDYNNHYYNSTIDYNPNKTVNMGAYFLLNNNNRSKDEVVNSAFYFNRSKPDSILNTNNLLKHNFKNYSIGTYLITQFKEDSKWENYIDRQYFRQSDQQMQQSDLFQSDELESKKQELEGNTYVKVNITTLQSKYQLNLHSNLAATFGGKYTHVDMRTNSQYQKLQDNKWQQNQDLSNAFGHTEKLKSLFLQLQHKISNAIILDMGLRYEDAAFNSLTTSKIDSNSTRVRSYKNFFPNTTLTYTTPTQQKLSLHYNRRVNRPNFRDLNPFVEINDPYLYEKGNPNLKPEFVNNMELTWIFRNTYSLQLSYTLKQDPISKSYNLDTHNRTVVMPMNLNYASGFGLRFNATSISPMQHWHIQANANLLYKNFQWNSSNKVHHNKRLTPAIQLQNQVKLPFKANLEINCFVNGSTVEGQANISHLWSINSGVRKTFFQDKFTLYIYANDLFRSNRPKITFTGEVMKGRYQESYDSRAFGINLSYRLSKGEGNNLKNNNTSNRLEENNRISY